MAVRLHIAGGIQGFIGRRCAAQAVGICGQCAALRCAFDNHCAAALQCIGQCIIGGLIGGPGGFAFDGRQAEFLPSIVTVTTLPVLMG